jgi:hypothetical protein
MRAEIAEGAPRRGRLAASSIGLSPLNFPFQIVSCREKSRNCSKGASSNPSAAAAGASSEGRDHMHAERIAARQGR